MIRGKKILAVITARGGSKGIPGKNVRDLLGMPLFMWSVLAALESQYVDRIFISSNCNEVYKIFHDFNLTNKDDRVKFVQRPDELATDTSKNELALIHTIHWARDIFKEEFDIVMNLQPTSPCRFGELVDETLEQYYLGGHDSLLTATKNTPFLWQKIDGKWVYNIDKNGCCNRKMRQEFKEDKNDSEFIYHDCGNIYITDSRILLDIECRIGYNPCIFEVSGMNGLQIDTEYDFTLIEKMAEIRGLNNLI